MNKGKFGRLFSAKYVTTLAILLALVVLFQVFGSYIKIGTTSFSFVLVPIVLGGVLLGVTAGAILGFAFSLVVMIMGLVGADPFTGILLNDALFGTLVCIFLKGVLAGVIPALLYKVIAKKNTFVAVIIASLTAPIVNTSIFIVCMLILGDVVTANFIEGGMSVIYFLVIICAGVNFLVEFAINAVLSPTLHRIITALGLVDKNGQLNTDSQNDAISEDEIN